MSKRPAQKPKQAKKPRCHAARDGECNWSGCPQNRDNEPRKTGRHCPLDCEGRHE